MMGRKEVCLLATGEDARKKWLVQPVSGMAKYVWGGVQIVVD